MIMQIEELYERFLSCHSVSTDTRSIPESSMFFALKGENFNGNEFAKKAIDQGASFSVVDEVEFADDDRIILVDNVLSALQALASYHRDQLNIPFIAITGSNGKTTTKELINAVLSKKYSVAYTEGNLNNHIGVPLTLLAIKDSHEIALIEMGDNHPKEVEFLCEIAKPSHGFVTNVGKDHLEGFGTFEKNIEAKKEVVDYLLDHKGIVFVDESDDLVYGMVDSKMEKVTYGLDSSFSNIQFVDSNPLVKFKSEEASIVGTHLFGAFNFNNIKLAYCIGKYFEVSNEDICSALRDFEPDNNRSQVINTDKNTLIMDAYNANPSSVEEAVNSFFEMDTTSPKILILGDMFELGSFSEEEHQNIAKLVVSKEFSDIILVGENYAKTKNISGAHIFSNKKDAEVYIKKIAPEGAIILLKGSRGMRMESLKSIL